MSRECDLCGMVLIKSCAGVQHPCFPSFRKVCGKSPVTDDPEVDDGLPDWAMLCNDCTKTHRTAIVPREKPGPETDAEKIIARFRTIEERLSEAMAQRMGGYSVGYAHKVISEAFRQMKDD